MRNILIATCVCLSLASCAGKAASYNPDRQDSIDSRPPANDFGYRGPVPSWPDFMGVTPTKRK